MTRFIIRRVLLSIPVLIGIIFLVFALARIIPGDPCSAALGERANAVTCELLRDRARPGQGHHPGRLPGRWPDRGAPRRGARDARRQPVRHLPPGHRRGRVRRIVQVRPAGDGPPDPTPADDRGADAVRADLRDHRGHHPRRHLRVPAQLVRRRRHHAHRQHRRLDAGLRAGPAARLLLRHHAQRHRRSSCRRRVALSAGADDPGTRGGLGPRGPLGSAPRGRRLPVEHLHVQCDRAARRSAPRRHGAAHDPARPGPRHDPPGDHRADDPLEPARRARARLRPDRAGQGPRPIDRSS